MKEIQESKERNMLLLKITVIIVIVIITIIGCANCLDNMNSSLKVHIHQSGLSNKNGPHKVPKVAKEKY